MDHVHLTSIANALANLGIGTYRFNFPFMQHGKRRVDSQSRCLEILEIAHKTAIQLSPNGRVFLAGHSFGGRMASHYLDSLSAAKTTQHSSTQPRCDGLICFSFPLHPSKKPAITRAEHLRSIRNPILLVSGDRDLLAEKPLLESVVEPLSNAQIYWLETADHGFKILKRSRVSTEDVYKEAARITKDWLDHI